jgi:hypothetical protein
LQSQEVGTRFGGTAASSDHQHRIAQTDGTGTISQIGDLAGGDFDGTAVGQQESNFLFSHIVRPFCKNLLVLYTTCKKHSGNSEKDGICRIQLIFSDCNHSGIDIKNSAAIRLQLKDRVRRNRGINPRKKSRKLITTRIPPILKNQQPDQYSEKIL